MKLRQLFESKKHGAAIIFGRFNPPHFGHSNAWAVASKFPIWYVGTNQDTQDAKNPLPFEVKVEAMKTIMPGIEGHLVAEQSWWTLATMVYKQHGGDMVLHIVTDPTDKEIFVPSLKKSNGVEGPHGFYQFQDVVWEPASRDSTATALRAAVEHDNPQAFSKAAGIDANTMIAGQPFFELVKHYMSPYLHAAAEKERAKSEKARLKAEKEAAKVAKKTKTVEPVQEDNSIKYANKIIREMRAREFLSEISTKPSGKMDKNHVDGGQGYMLSRDIGGYDRVYHLNRIMMAAAMADGKNKKPVDMDASSWVEKYNVAFPYTDEEHLMMFQAMATIPTDGGELEKRGKSKEPDDTNKVSAVAKPKKNKYGI